MDGIFQEKFMNQVECELCRHKKRMERISGLGKNTTQTMKVKEKASQIWAETLNLKVFGRAIKNSITYQIFDSQKYQDENFWILSCRQKGN